MPSHFVVLRALELAERRFTAEVLIVGSFDVQEAGYHVLAVLGLQHRHGTDTYLTTDKAMRTNFTIDLQHFSSHCVPMKVVMTNSRVRRVFDHPASADRPQAIHFGLSSFARCAVRCFSQSTRFLFAIPDFQHQQPFSGPTRHLYKDNGRPGYQDGHQKHKQFQASCKA